METTIDRLERLSALAHDAGVIVEIRDDMIRDLDRAGVHVPDLMTITGLSRARIYQLLERPVDRLVADDGRDVIDN